MAGQIAAHRYAKSLIGLADEKSQLDAVNTDMELIASTVAQSRELRMLLNSPVIKADKKLNVLNKIFAAQVGEISNKFMTLLVNKKREELLEGIANDYQAQYKSLKGLVVANVTTAIALDDATRKKVLELVQKNVEGQIELVETVNPDIIGGFVVRIGDKMIDASIAKKINDLKKELLGSSSYTVKLN